MAGVMQRLPAVPRDHALRSVLDALTANDDRHLNNFGFLFDNASRRVTGAAPVFDNNLALFMRDIDSGLTAADLASTAGGTAATWT